VTVKREFLTKRVIKTGLLIIAPTVFFTLASLLLITCSVLIADGKKPDRLSLSVPSSNVKQTIYSAQPPVLGVTTQAVGAGDARGLIVEQYLATHHSPLAPYGRYMVSIADKYGLPWNLLPSIAMQESSGGKSLPEGSYNPFGWAIYGDMVKGFSSWEEGIDTVALGLKRHYFDQGLTTPESIMPKYCPPSLAKGGPWAKGVTYFMEEMENF